MFTTFALLAALVHFVFFLIESVYFMNPKVHRIFGIQDLATAESVKLIFFNQGFYNLFLTCGVIIGTYLSSSSAAGAIAGNAITLFCCASMLAAAAVLFASKPKMIRGVLIQGFFPLLALLSYIIF